MTKYMTEELGCKVYIIEIDEKAYSNAIQYAADGVCGDISSYEWYEKFSQIGEAFDYIIFADVLEHLTDPSSIMEKASDLLKDSGEVIISYPNLSHGDIINNLYYNRFIYTDLGILDDSHVHFVTRDNLDEFVYSAGLRIKEIDRIIVPPFGTEQAKYLDPYLHDEDEERLLGKIDADVYQYILVCVKNNYFISNGLSTRETITAAPYGIKGTVKYSKHDETLEIIPIKLKGNSYEYRLTYPSAWEEVVFIPVIDHKYAIKGLQAKCNHEYSLECGDAIIRIGEYYISEHENTGFIIKTSGRTKENNVQIGIKLEMRVYSTYFNLGLIDAVSGIKHAKKNNKYSFDKSMITKLISCQKERDSDEVINKLYEEIKELKRVNNGLRWELLDAQYDARI